MTLGQLAPGVSPTAICANTEPFDMVQPTVTAGNTYVVPPIGPQLITSWSHNASAGAGQTLALKVWRKVADPTTYRVVAHDGPRTLTPSVVNTFTGLNLLVQPGDVIGLNDGTVPNACLFAVAGETHLELQGNLADGAPGAFGTSTNRLNITASLNPSNIFTLGTVQKNKTKGIATLTVNVPQPGELALGGNGVKPASAGAVISKAVGAGEAKLKIKAQGKKKRKLNETGKVKLSPSVTFTPTGGDPSAQSLKLKLKKN